MNGIPEDEFKRIAPNLYAAIMQRKRVPFRVYGKLIVYAEDVYDLRNRFIFIENIDKCTWVIVKKFAERNFAQWEIGLN